MAAIAYAGHIHFNPRSPCGERRGGCGLTRNGWSFQSTLPVWGATTIKATSLDYLSISIHAPRVGSDLLVVGDGARVLAISIHAPRVGSDQLVFSIACRAHDFNPRSPCGERRSEGANIGTCKISIHAPRVGSDLKRVLWPQTNVYFNPRSPCGERLSVYVRVIRAVGFQSTLPVWGATSGERGRLDGASISIHAPRVGSDWLKTEVCPKVTLFQSTLPVWGATAPSAPSCPGARYFNPRSPCGERHFLGHKAPFAGRFQSTLPVWGATSDNRGAPPF